MAYLGVSPSNGVRQKHTYTATASQTSFSGAGAENITLSYKDSNYVDVYQNGVKLSEADYTATTGTTVVLATGATVSDMIEVVVYDVFSVADTVSKADGGTFDGNVTMGGTLDVTGNGTVGGTLGITGAVTANAGVNIDNITIDGTEIDLSSGNLTIDVAGQLVINSDSGQVVLQDDTVNWGDLQNSSGDFVIESLGADKDIIFKGLDGSSTIEAARFDMSGAGSLLVGKANTTAGVTGIELETSGTIVSTRDGNTNIFLNRTSSAGNLIEFRKDNTAVGTISTDFDTIAITGNATTASHTSGLAFVSSSSAQRIVPCQQGTSIADDTMNLGGSGQRFDDIHASNGTIQTSDRNEKQDIEELNDAEKRVAVVAKGLMRKFRWKSKVEIKGDNARTHFGIIAQDLEDAFKAEGLDATKYAMFCSDTWWEKEITVDAVEADEEKGIEAKDAYTRRDVREEATEGYTEKTRLGVRYSELLAFIISAI